MGAALTSALFAPDTMRPAQFFTPTERPLLSERALACAVVEFAWQDAFSRHPIYRPEAREFFASVDRGWPYSFENLCESIGLDPTAVRRALANGDPAAVRFYRDESGTRTQVSLRSVA